VTSLYELLKVGVQEFRMMTKEAERTGSHMPFNEVTLMLFQYLQIEFNDEVIRDKYFDMILFDIVHRE